MRIDECIEGIRHPIALALAVIAPVLDFIPLSGSSGAIRACSASSASSRFGGIRLPSEKGIPLDLSAGQIRVSPSRIQHDSITPTLRTQK